VTRLDALRVPPGNQFKALKALKALKGANAGVYRLRVNDQYRIRFTFREEYCYGVCCKDFHVD
jgi:plasmid maintenance system killer protein